MDSPERSRGGRGGAGAPGSLAIAFSRLLTRLSENRHIHYPQIFPDPPPGLPDPPRPGLLGPASLLPALSRGAGQSPPHAANLRLIRFLLPRAQSYITNVNARSRSGVSKIYPFRVLFVLFFWFRVPFFYLLDARTAKSASLNSFYKGK